MEKEQSEDDMWRSAAGLNQPSIPVARPKPMGRATSIPVARPKPSSLDVKGMPRPNPSSSMDVKHKPPPPAQNPDRLENELFGRPSSSDDDDADPPAAAAAAAVASPKGGSAAAAAVASPKKKKKKKGGSGAHAKEVEKRFLELFQKNPDKPEEIAAELHTAMSQILGRTRRALPNELDRYRKWHTKYGLAYANVSLQSLMFKDKACSLSELIWLTVGICALSLNGGPLPPEPEDSKERFDYAKCLMPRYYMKNRRTEAQIRELEIRVATSILRDKSAVLNREKVAVANDTFYWLRFLPTLFERYPLTPNSVLASREDEEILADFLARRLQQTKLGKFEEEGRGLVIEQHLPIGARLRYRRKHVVHGGFDAVVDIMQDSLMQAELLRINDQSRAKWRYIGVPEASIPESEKLRLDENSTDAWLLQEYRSFIRQNSPNQVDWIERGGVNPYPTYCILQAHWGTGSDMALLEMKFRGERRRLPILCYFGYNQWAVHHNDQFIYSVHAGRQVLSALVAQHAIIMREFGGMIEDGTPMPDWRKLTGGSESIDNKD